MTTLPVAGHTQSSLSSSSPRLARGALRGSGFGSARGAASAAAPRRRRCRAPAGGSRRRRRGGGAVRAAACALHLAQRLLGVRLLQRLGLRLVVVGVARPARGGAPPAAAPAARVARDHRRRRRSGVVVTPAPAARRAGIARRGEAQHLADADQVEVLDAVPGGELAIVEPVVERDLRTACRRASPCRSAAASRAPAPAARRGARRRPARPAARRRRRRAPRPAPACATRTPASSSDERDGAQRRSEQRMRESGGGCEDGGHRRSACGARDVVHARPDSNGTNLTASSVCSR